MPYEVILLVLGILLLLIGFVGKVKAREFQVETNSGMARIVMAFVGIVLVVLSFNPDITKTFLSSPKQMGEDTQGSHQELEEKAEQAGLAEEQRLKEVKAARLAEDQNRKTKQARIAEEQHLIIPTSEGDKREPTVEGTIIFKGDPPPPKKFELSKFPNSNFCGQVDTNEKGERVLKEATVKNGKLQDVVVLIKGITEGKPMDFKGTDVLADKCRFLVQNGPSTFVGVVVNKDRIRVLNNDADPSDPKSADGILHNPHAYEIVGKKSSTMFNLPLPTKGQTVDQKVKLRKEKKGSFMKLECDQHNYMVTWLYPVKNPYYAIVGSTGTYSIDKVPPGKYKILAWHPILGKLEKEILVGKTGKLAVNFEFKIKSR